ncbi:stage II sporulation protein D [Paenibacillus hamazuiensis]|uniref:stage II sporulation protein D n=1 Tax=Paenibacillus hamazuiensis TaxID=2936508 RepID=UPI00200F2829|nr:stage II sporulation protein D [Paenibacillus hamazuiensis]
MKQRKRSIAIWVGICLASLLVTIMLVPAILVKRGLPNQAGAESAGLSQGGDKQADKQVMVPVYMTKQQRTEQIGLEQYVKGVLAAEMPIEFEPEALKAQAMAARTYIIRRMSEQDASNVPVKDALVTDTIAHQAYVTDEELKERWGPQYEVNMDKLVRAVRETEDIILTYQGQPINATFFSTSNGYTENAEDYWGQYIPYLRSVESPWDRKLSPRFKETVSIPIKDVQRKLGLGSIVPVSTKSAGIRVLEKTKGQRIKTLSIGGKVFSGREVREKLGLNSSGFEWTVKGSDLVFTTYGYGHGVGMSQWGANGMAKEGSKAEDIVKHYYTGIELSHSSVLFPKK